LRVTAEDRTMLSVRPGERCAALLAPDSLFPVVPSPTMILSDRELHALLPQMAFETDEHQRPFRPEEQIQPCSIDLRLDRCFWVPKRGSWRHGIDFRRTTQGEIDIRRLFPSRWLRLGEGITIKPGQMVLGRTFEKFTIPNGYAGKLEGRSTFARLGLSIHCTGDFINPGWRGRMPLQLVNHGVVPIVLTPYLPMCQLVVMRATSDSQRPYGSTAMGHKYMNDEGEPSRYWQDVRIRSLQEACGRVNLPARTQQEFLRAIGSRDVELVDRFLQFLHSLPAEGITSPRDILERFADRDTRKMTWAKRRLQFYRWFPLLPLSTSLGLLFKWPYEWPHYVLWGVTLALLPLGLWGVFFAKEPGQPFSRRDVEDHFAETA
jgi:deoxycytidine triphosphate deaminase